MLNKIRYHHENFNSTSFQHRGFSVAMIPVDQEYVELRHTFCSNDDQFCKKTARAYLDEKEGSIIPVALLPTALAVLAMRAKGLRGNASRWRSNSYAWVWKYFL